MGVGGQGAVLLGAAVGTTNSTPLEIRDAALHLWSRPTAGAGAAHYLDDGGGGGGDLWVWRRIACHARVVAVDGLVLRCVSATGGQNLLGISFGFEFIFILVIVAQKGKAPAVPERPLSSLGFADCAHRTDYIANMTQSAVTRCWGPIADGRSGHGHRRF